MSHSQQATVAREGKVLHRPHTPSPPLPSPPLLSLPLCLSQAKAEQKKSREKCVEKQLRLGRFNTKRCGVVWVWCGCGVGVVWVWCGCDGVGCVCRQGAQFVEVWVDGFAFTDLTARQEELATQREELEKQKKQLNKKKAGTVASTQRDQLEREEILKIRAAVLKKVSLGHTPTGQQHC